MKNRSCCCLQCDGIEHSTHGAARLEERSDRLAVKLQQQRDDAEKIGWQADKLHRQTLLANLIRMLMY